MFEFHPTTMLSRRQFLWSAAAAGGLAVGLSAKPLLALRRRLTGVPALGDPGWIQIAPDGFVTIYSSLIEMGQGVWTSLAQIVADELDADWTRVRVVMAPSLRAYYKPLGFWTGGSSSTVRLYGEMRTIAASVRAMLIGEAARRWNVRPEACQTIKGDVVHTPTGRRVMFGALADAAARNGRAGPAQLKPRERWQLMGRSPPRLDVPAKVNGTAKFGTDVRLPDMRFAAISQSPLVGGSIASIDREAAAARAGVERVIVLDDTVAVVARSSWEAMRGLAEAKVVWRPPAVHHSTAELETLMRQAVRPGATSPAGPTNTVEATYFAPLLRHAQLEPINATARAGRFDVEVWTSTQAQEAMQSDIGHALGVWSNFVTIHSTLIGGGFGRRLATDYGVTAARVAREHGGTVHCFWEREGDSGQARHRTMAVARLRAELDAEGLPKNLETHVAAIGAEPHLGGLKSVPYAIPTVSADYSGIATPIRIGSWRSVDASQNIFFLESFIDECAAAAHQDAVDYRARLLQKNARALRVLDAVATQANWHSAKADGRFLGLAFQQALGTISATIIEVTRPASGTFRIERIFSTVDCGIAIHPDNIRAQLEGGALFALSAALREEVVIENGDFTARNFDGYRVLTLREAPPVEVQILETADVPLGGMGEVGVPMTAPALANALFAATGTRVRDLPLSRSKLELSGKVG